MRQLTATTPAEGYAACCELLAQLDLTPDLPAITAPTLVISGTADAALPADHGRSIMRLHTGCAIRDNRQRSTSRHC